MIPHNYSAKDLSGKEKNKKELLKQFSLQYKKEVPLIGIVSRFAIQKGFDLIQTALSDLMEIDAQWIILGSGEREYENSFIALQEQLPDKVGVHIGYNEKLAHLIEAGADIFLMPSHYEPCGLNQIYSLKYGTVPVVRKTGGLADTVQDWDEQTTGASNPGTGFSFLEYNPLEMIQALQRALNAYKNKSTWEKIQLNGMKKDFSWKNSALKYKSLYEKAKLKN
jgi:starch synthase